MNLEQAVLAFKKTNKAKISLGRIRTIMKKVKKLIHCL